MLDKIRTNGNRKHKDAWYRHRKKWRDCQRCPLGEQAQNHVFARGTLPCKILFVGEAPGESEDIIGKPFVGPSGIMLEKLIARIEVNGQWKNGRIKHFPTYAITNTLCCFPQRMGRSRPPEKSELAACQNRLVEFIKLSEAKAFVALGPTATSVLIDILGKSDELTGPVLTLKHPSYLLRSGRETEKARFVVSLIDWIKKEKI